MGAVSDEPEVAHMVWCLRTNNLLAEFETREEALAAADEWNRRDTRFWHRLLGRQARYYGGFSMDLHGEVW